MEMKRLSILAPGALVCLAAIASAASVDRMNPLKVSENGHFLVDGDAKPFFILADTAWPLFSGLSREDVEYYLDDRKARGFNTILCSLLDSSPDEKTPSPPRHRVYGFRAFEGNNRELSRPNKQYWGHVDWVIRQARRRRLRLAIVPFSLAAVGVEWTDQLTRAAETHFGEYLGIRTCNYNNIIWLFADDYPSSRDRRALRIMVEGIRYYAPHHLITCRNGNDAASSFAEQDERWLAFNSIRTGRKEHPGEYSFVQQSYLRTPTKPTWLAEPFHEQPGSRFAVRQAAWRSVLNGGIGFGYGVSDMFDRNHTRDWKDMLDMPGAGDVARMLDILNGRPWHKLMPDHAANKRLLRAVESDANIHFPSACSTDGDFGLIYLPVRAAVAVDMGRLNENVTAQWYSPTTADFVEVQAEPLTSGDVHTIAPPEAGVLPGPDLVLVLTASAPAEATKNYKTVLGTDKGKFTINGKNTFLFGISYYGAIGARPDFRTRDLDDMQKLGINWIRVWATWGAFGNDVTVVDDKGNSREPYMSGLKKLVAESDERGMIVDVTLSRGNGVTGKPRLQSQEAHKQAVKTIVTELEDHRNWYLDLGNERNIMDKRYVSMADLVELRETVRQIDKARLVTASRAGDIPYRELQDYIQKAKLDFVCPHRPRSAVSARQTKNKSLKYITAMKQIDTVVPLHYQEPFRRGFTKGWEPRVDDFLTDAKQAIAGGAAGWCLHNGDQKNMPESKPRRSFDMREKRLFDQLDKVEKQALEQISEIVPNRLERR